MEARDKRRLPRRPHDSVVELYDDAGAPAAGAFRLVDVSWSGACFVSTERLAPGRRLTARLRLLERGVVEVSARVVWAKPRGNATLYGLSFEGRRRGPGPGSRSPSSP